MDIKPSRKILPVYLGLDVSGSMDGAPIAAVNRAMDEILPALRQAGGDNPFAELQVCVITFGQGARVHLPLAPLNGSSVWSHVGANDGCTDLGALFDVFSRELGALSARKAQPLLIVLSDGEPTDAYQSALASLNGTPWGKPGRTTRIGIRVGNCSRTALEEFTGDSAMVLDAGNAVEVANYLKWATITVSKTMSGSVVNGMASLPPPPDMNTDGAADVF